MIIKEQLIINKKAFIKTYSDKNLRVVRDGIEYDEAIDPVDSKREYTESTNKRMGEEE